MAKEVNRLNDKAIKAKLKAAKPFDVADGAGLWLRLREGATAPVFRFRYRYGNAPQVMVLGKYGTGGLTLKDARERAAQLSTDLTNDVDIAEDARKIKAEAVAKSAGADNVYTVSKLADDFYRRKVLGKVKHPDVVLKRIEKDIRPRLGALPVVDVRPRDVRRMLESVVARGARTMANDVLRITKRMFNEAVKDEVIEYNPASPYDYSDAGGEEEARSRALSRDELVKFFEAMGKTPGFSVQNALTFKLLLLLAVRKTELVAAPVREFDLKAAVWALPAERTKTEAAIDIPLSAPALACLRELIRMGGGDAYLLPARKSRDGGLDHIHENTLNVALSKVRPHMKGVPAFTIHDFRRTARTHLGALKIGRDVAEKCLNHKAPGVAGTYDRHDYFDDRRHALAVWAELVEAAEAGQDAMTKWWAAFEKREAAKQKAGRS